MASFYSKRGNKTSEEKKYIKELEKFISDNPDAKIKPATNSSQLKKLWEKHCIETVDYTESPADDNDAELDKILNEQNSDTNDVDDTADSFSNTEPDLNDSTDNDYIDPFNRQEPVIRDYVQEGDRFSRDGNTNQASGQTSFSEPQNFKDSFEIPSDDNKDGNGGNSSSSNSFNSDKKEKAPKADPVNPQWDSMDAAKKRKSTKRFAKYIVEFACMCSEKGFVWYSGKNIDINIKIIKEEFDPTLMVTLTDQQQITIIQFFEMQRMEGEALAKISDDDKQELADALASWLMEKGFAPNASQELMIVALSIFGKQAVLLFAHVAKTNSVVSQLRGDRQETEDQPTQEIKRDEPPVTEPEPAPEQPVKKPKAKKKKAEEGNFETMKQIGDATKE